MSFFAAFRSFAGRQGTVSLGRIPDIARVKATLLSGMYLHLSGIALSDFPINSHFRESSELILPATDGHPVKRVHYATEVNHGKTKSSKEDPETVFERVQA